MAEFAGEAVAAFEDGAVDDDAAAAAGAEDDAEDDFTTGGGAIGGFGEGEAVGIVGDADFAVKEGLEVLIEGVAVQRDGVGIFNEAGGGADAAGDADADGGAGADFGLGGLHEGGDIGEGFGVAGGGGGAAAQDFLALGVEDEDFSFGAAEVDADAISHGVVVGAIAILLKMLRGGMLLAWQSV